MLSQMLQHNYFILVINHITFFLCLDLKHIGTDDWVRKYGMKNKISKNLKSQIIFPRSFSFPLSVSQTSLVSLPLAARIALEIIFLARFQNLFYAKMRTEFSKDANFPKSDVNSGHAREVKQPCRGEIFLTHFVWKKNNDDV